MRRTAQRARRSSLTEKEREQLLEKRRSTNEMKRTRVCDATNNEGRAGTSSVHDANIIITCRSPRFIEQVQCQDEDAAEASRKRKGKSIAPYQVCFLSLSVLGLSKNGCEFRLMFNNKNCYWFCWREN
ncbi:hypothetical protein MKW98_030220 [Papaver atlanticum]|uniref:Uncharacterized protein n=1 Tax=Papaver atlanticum TaxID=357466 RepID=A0AAD4XPH0_9MAGN|nr:hypothetical protein MKW98_030220 [Papaver atlanticum]